MNEPVFDALFTCPILSEHVHLHTITSAAQKDNIEFIVGPKFDPNNWYMFANGTEECLNNIN